ncbi:hypothetical protein Tco_0130060, partial [Tanacetum coccineum]
MAAPIISISLNLSEESVGSYIPRVILFGIIPAIIPVIHEVPAEVPIVPADPLVAPEVGAVFAISPIGVLDLVDYSSSDSDLSEDSLPPAPELPLVSPFLCSDDSEVDSELHQIVILLVHFRSSVAEQRSKRHESLASHDVMFSIAHVVAPPGIRRRPAILIRFEEAIPFGRSYRTHPNRPRKLLTERKRVRPFPALRLAWRRVSHRSLDCHSSPGFTSDSYSSSSFSDSSSVHSSGFDASGQTHSGPSTRVASSGLVYPPVMTPR